MWCHKSVDHRYTKQVLGAIGVVGPPLEQTKIENKREYLFIDIILPEYAFIDVILPEYAFIDEKPKFDYSFIE